MTGPLHTPGPFEAKVATASIPTMHIHSPRGVIASVHGARNVRDAQLFAAAPELLAAAEAMLASFGWQSPNANPQCEAALAETRAAIAKAKGGAS